MATSVLGLKTFAASDPVDVNEVNDNYVKIDNGVKTAMQGRAAHNLFDNSNFRINQLGQTSYTANGYTVDRWAIYKWSNDSSVSINLSVNADGVNLSGGVSTASTPSSCYLYQKIDCSRIAGKTLTAAVYINSLSGAGTGIIGAYNNTTYIKGANLKVGMNLLVFDVPTSATVLMIKIGNDASRAGKGSITASIKWAALYEGTYTADTLPAYVPKDNELAECRRYHKEFSGLIQFPVTVTVDGWVSVAIDYTDMRVTPTIVYDLAGLYIGDTLYSSVTSIEPRALPSSELMINVGAGVKANKTGTIRFNSLALSSDL